MGLVIEKSPSKAPIYTQPVEALQSRLRTFIALPDSTFSILGPRRIPGLNCPNQNTASSIAISTSVGFQTLQTSDYDTAASVLQPDIVTGLVDIPSHENLSQRRREKSADRTYGWLQDAIRFRENKSIPQPLIMASIPNLEPEQQAFYLAELAEGFLPSISGLCLHGIESAAFLPKTIQHLPRLALTSPASPQDLLRAVQLGVDLITVPFITSASENGVVLDFNFSNPPIDATNIPLGFGLWSVSHASDLRPLAKDCTCYACTRHHRAYIQHLLNAKEMLAWTLLQIHNFCVIEVFFQQIRRSIANDSFIDDVKTFNRVYSTEIPSATGHGPRVRGYQVKSIGGGETKKNRKAYGRLDEHIEKLAEAEDGILIPGPNAGSVELEKLASGDRQV